MSQCSSNPCELWETQKPHVHSFGFDSVKPGGTGFGKPVVPILCQPDQRLVVWILSGIGFWNPVAPVLTKFATANFWGVGYLYPWVPTVANCYFLWLLCASLIFLAKAKAILALPNPSLWGCLILVRSSELGGREKPLWAIQEHLNPLSTVGHHQACVKHLLLLEVCLLDG